MDAATIQSGELKSQIATACEREEEAGVLEWGFDDPSRLLPTQNVLWLFEKNLGMLVDKNWMWGGILTCAHCPENQMYPGLHQKEHDQQVEGGCSPLYTALRVQSPPRVLCAALESPAQDGHALVWEGPEEGHKCDLEHLSHENRLTVGIIQSWE